MTSNRPENVWIVGKTTEATQNQWEFQGVFDSVELAVAACVADEFFVGPAIMNEALPTEPVEWFGSWYPRLQQKPESE